MQKYKKFAILPKKTLFFSKLSYIFVKIRFMEHKKYILKKEYKCPLGTLPEGSEIITFGDHVLFNGGMVMPAYVNALLEIVNNPDLNKEYLKESKMIYNKI